MDGITKELAAKAAEFYKVSEQNREVWMAGFAAGYLGGKVHAFSVVSGSCDAYANKIVEQIKSGTAEESLDFRKQKNMKRKEQILEWLDKQPWKGEFYEEVFLNGSKYQITYNVNFICVPFDWAKTKSGTRVWEKRDTEFRKWYNSNDKPMSWEEYCRQNPIKEGDCRINKYSQCSELDPDVRFANSDANVMSEDLCKAFVAYMKLIQLRNAWVKDCENGDDDEYLKIVYTTERGFYVVRLGKTGLSFPTSDMAEEFINTFKDLLDLAKPLI